MLHVKDSLFLWCAAIHQGNFGSKVMGNLARRCESLEQPESTVSYTPWGNLTGRFLNSAVFSLHLRRDIGQSSAMIFQLRIKLLLYKKSLRNHVGSGDICRTI